MFKQLLRKPIKWIGNLIQSETAKQELIIYKSTLRDINYQQIIHNSPHFLEQKRLLKHGYQVLSQSDEDGIILEIFNRIGLTNKYFVEFGVGAGLENNSASLLFQQWSGMWIEGDHTYVENINQHLSRLIKSGKLKLQEAFVDENNIEQLLTNNEVPFEPDLFSIDVDSIDYYIWNALNRFKPRVIVIEYNGSWGPSIEWIMPRDEVPSSTINTSCYGASLKSLEILGTQKGYSLVGCNMTGVNAFFVRDDLVQDLFASPFTSENHYEPPRYHLLRQIGHARSYNIYR